jgi:hypothetical protein
LFDVLQDEKREVRILLKIMNCLFVTNVFFFLHFTNINFV